MASSEEMQPLLFAAYLMFLTRNNQCEADEIEPFSNASVGDIERFKRLRSSGVESAIAALGVAMNLKNDDDIRKLASL